MLGRNALETRKDRVAMAQDAGLGRVSLVSVLAGTLVAYGAFAVVLAITAAVAKAAGLGTELVATEWRQLGVAGGIVVAMVLLVSYFFGGYVAGRMARRAGVTNGLVVFVLSLVVAVLVTGLVNLFTDGDEILGGFRNIGVPTSWDEWSDIGTVAGIGSLLAMLVGAVAGGALGERWHASLVKRALDPSIGPEAEARAAAEERHRQAEERMTRSRLGRRRDDVDERTVVDPDVRDRPLADDVGQDDVRRRPVAGPEEDRTPGDEGTGTTRDGNIIRRDR